MMSIPDAQARAEANFRNAVSALQKSIPKETRSLIDNVKLPDFDGSIDVESCSTAMEGAIGQLFEAIATRNKVENAIERARLLARKWFRASFPFAKKIAYEESQRLQEVDSIIEILSGATQRIELVKRLPDDMDQLQLENVRTASINLCASVFSYIAFAIRQLQSGTPRNMLRNLFRGSTEFADVCGRVDVAIKTYNSALDDLGLLAAMESRNHGKMIYRAVEDLSYNMQKISVKLESLGSFSTKYVPTEAKTDSLHDEEWTWTSKDEKNFDGMSRQDLLDWIFPGDFEEKHRAVRSKRAPGSALWFLNRAEFQDWISGVAPNILHCPGPAGSGKTVLTSIVIDKIEKDSQEKAVGLAYAYLNYKDKIQQTPSNILSSFIKQFASRLDSPVPQLFMLQRFRLRGKQPELQDLVSCLISLSTLFSTVFLVVDALDECEKSQRRILLNAIKQLSDARFRIFTTCRPYLGDVRRCFKDSPKIFVRADSDDVKNYLRTRLEEEITEYTKLNNQIVESISISARGLFLLAAAQLNYVLQFKSPKNRRAALEKSVPTELFDAYETVINAIHQTKDDSSELVQTILSWIFHSRRPLRMEELREAVSIQVGDLGLTEEDLIAVDDIVEVCGSLVNYDVGSRVVSFSHETVQEFLKTRYMGYLLPESELGKVCLTYLSFDDFNEFCADEAQLAMRLEKRPFALYAAKFWGSHIKDAAAETDTTFQELLIQLTNSPPKVDSMHQLCEAETSAEWNSSEIHRGMSLLHVLAMNNLLMFARSELNRVTADATTDAEGSNCQAPGSPNVFERAKSLLGKTTSQGSTPLHFAASEGHADMVKLLLDFNADIEAKNCHGNTPLLRASFKGQIGVVELLLSAKANPNNQNNGEYTALHFASWNGHLAVIKKLIPLTPDVNVRPKLMTKEPVYSPLQLASRYGLVAVVKFLIQANADPNLPGPLGWLALHLASRHGHMNVVDSLLTFIKSPIDALTTAGYTAFHLAAVGGFTEVMSRLLSLGAAINTTAPDGKSPLHSAASDGNLHVVKWLVEAGSDVSLTDKEYGRTAFHYAVLGGHLEVVRYLSNSVTDINLKQTLNGMGPLHLAASTGSVAMIDLLLSLGASMIAQAESGATPLLFAAANGYVKAVEILLTATALDVPMNDGRSPLHAAAAGGHHLVIRVLLDGKADASMRDEKGATPLLLASCFGHVEAVRTLLDKRTLEIPDQNGLTPLHFAAKLYPRIVEVLLDEGADVHRKEPEYDLTPFHYAVFGGNVEAVNIFITRGVDVDDMSTYVGAALAIAAYTGKLQVVDMLLEANANVRLADGEGWTALHHASCEGYDEIVDRLLAHADQLLIDATTSGGNTALMLASLEGKLEVVKKLLTANADFTTRNKNGRTALHDAASGRYVDIVQVLLGKHRKPLARFKDDSVDLSVDSIRDSRRLDAGSTDHLMLLHHLVDIYPEDSLFRCTLGYAYITLGSVDLASAAFDETIALDLINKGASSIDDISHRCACSKCSVEYVRGYLYLCLNCPDDQYVICHQCFNGLSGTHCDHKFLKRPSEDWVRQNLKAD